MRRTSTHLSEQPYLRMATNHGFSHLQEVGWSEAGTSGLEEAFGSGSRCWFTVRFRERAVEGAVKPGRDPGNQVTA
jgi:hypothetical protein